MPNITTKLGRYCDIHRCYHDEEYLECDYCNEHKDWIGLNDRYYNYGFSRRSYLACMECHDTMFGPFRLVDGQIMLRAYEEILEVINDKTEKKGNETINFYEAVRIAYTGRHCMRMFINSELEDIAEKINKTFRPIWEFTYKIVSGEEWKRVKVVNRDPDILLVQWVPGGKTITEILKEMNKGCRSILFT